MRSPISPISPAWRRAALSILAAATVTGGAGCIQSPAGAPGDPNTTCTGSCGPPGDAGGGSEGRIDASATGGAGGTSAAGGAPVAPCRDDLAEVGPGVVRNDTSAAATVLAAIDAIDVIGVRYETSGLICHPGGQDRDWYRFNVPPGSTGFCMAADFDPVVGDLRLSLFHGGSEPNLDVPCTADADCSSPGFHVSRRCLPTGVCGCETDADCTFEGFEDPADAFCVEQRCETASYRSSAGPASAHFSVDPDIVGDVGDRYALVEGVDGAEYRYDLAVTINPASSPCRPDWRERRNDNDHPPDATHLGAGLACVCDAWLCADEQGLGDWYSFDILPDDLDRSVLITFGPGGEGARLRLEMGDPAAIQVFERDPAITGDPRVECVNIRAHALGGRVRVQVDGRPQPQAQPLDYVLSIIPTDLATDPNGACGGIFMNSTTVWHADQPAP